jgi:23S rRNA pseudouridine2604 synthase
MRSDRDIQRVPKRPTRAAASNAPAPAAAHSTIPVSTKPPTGTKWPAPGQPAGRSAAPAGQAAGRPPKAPSGGAGKPFNPPPGPRRVPRAEAPPPQVQPAPRAPTPRTSTEEGVRLSKLLSDRGLASRREADDWIAAGWVLVDGVMAVLGQRVKPEARIEIDPAAHDQQARRVTILVHKPIGYVSGQAEDGYEPAAVLVTTGNHWADDPVRRPFQPGHARGLAPAGRLDIDSTGLLVLTQDGRIARHLIGEDSIVEKEYLVRVQYERGEKLPEEDLKRLQHGLMLDGKELKPAKVSWANEDQLRFVLREGRKRQIRRMCELVGLKVVGLKRVRIGSVVLGKLPLGQWRYLRDDERF